MTCTGYVLYFLYQDIVKLELLHYHNHLLCIYTKYLVEWSKIGNLFNTLGVVILILDDAYLESHLLNIACFLSGE